MAHSPLLGTDLAAEQAAGRDAGALGPSDSSDSGSDLAGLETDDGGDPAVATDIGLRDEEARGVLSSDALFDGASSDAGGTGERRSAAGDAGPREAADIGVDRIFKPSAPGLSDDAEDDDVDHDDEDADLAFIDTAQAAEALGLPIGEADDPRTDEDDAALAGAADDGSQDADADAGEDAMEGDPGAPATSGSTGHEVHRPNDGPGTRPRPPGDPAVYDAAVRRMDDPSTDPEAAVDGTPDAAA